MAKEPKKRGVGRPHVPKPKRLQVCFRIDEEVAAALAKYRDKLGVVELPLSDAARNLLVNGLKGEGLL